MYAKLTPEPKVVHLTKMGGQQGFQFAVSSLVSTLSRVRKE
jgi:hypothetical protein